MKVSVRPRDVPSPSASPSRAPSSLSWAARMSSEPDPTVNAVAGSAARPAGVGLIGLGTMGRPMAGHLLTAGHEVHVHARRPAATEALVAAGAIAHPTASSLARRCGVVVLVVPDLPDVEAVLAGPDGLLAGLDHPLTLVICSTVSPDGVRGSAHAWPRRPPASSTSSTPPSAAARPARSPGHWRSWSAGGRTTSPSRRRCSAPADGPCTWARSARARSPRPATR